MPCVPMFFTGLAMNSRISQIALKARFWSHTFKMAPELSPKIVFIYI